MNESKQNEPLLGRPIVIDPNLQMPGDIAFESYEDFAERKMREIAVHRLTELLTWPHSGSH